jgi:hypothetical protein
VGDAVVDLGFGVAGALAPEVPLRPISHPAPNAGVRGEIEVADDRLAHLGSRIGVPKPQGNKGDHVIGEVFDVVVANRLGEGEFGVMIEFVTDDIGGDIRGMVTVGGESIEGGHDGGELGGLAEIGDDRGANIPRPGGVIRRPLGHVGEVDPWLIDLIRQGGDEVTEVGRFLGQVDRAIEIGRNEALLEPRGDRPEFGAVVGFGVAAQAIGDFIGRGTRIGAFHLLDELDGLVEAGEGRGWHRIKLQDGGASILLINFRFARSSWRSAPMHSQ